MTMTVVLRVETPVSGQSWIEAYRIMEKQVKQAEIQLSCTVRIADCVALAQLHHRLKRSHVTHDPRLLTRSYN